MHARKKILFHDKQPWTKKSNNNYFDVPKGSFDGAEVCELDGTYLLNQLPHSFDKRFIGLYRDDGLAIIKNKSGPEIESIKKALIKTFNDHELKITVEANIKSVDFLDITFDLNSNTYKPYNKPSNNILYIHNESNHPPSVIKQLPKSVDNRISKNSSNATIFNENIGPYVDALKASGFNDVLKYQKENTINNKNKRKRNITWYNPPYSKSVITNIGKIFLKMIKKHFPKQNPLSKIFNKNTLKISYKCVKNINTIIASHNKHILTPKSTSHGCNCSNNRICPLDGKCLTPKVIYKAEITNNNNNEIKFYIGISETPFKTRYNNHLSSINKPNNKQSTELSKYVLGLKNDNISYSIKWSILSKINNTPRLNNCKLCLMEKFWIINSIDDTNCLNKRSEFVNKCRHINKYVLNSIK